MTVEQVSHRNLAALRAAFEAGQAAYYRGALDGVEQTLRFCYRDREVSPQ